jgi:hypothetical protein
MSEQQPTAQVVTITPKMAEQMLEKNTANRAVRPRTVSRYARDMVTGNWKVNGEGIVCCADGRVLNGQHRLHACVLSGVPFDSLVVTGIAPDAFPTFDTGTKRTLGDSLRARGVSQPDAKGAALNFALRWDAHVITDVSLRPTISESLAWLDDHTDFYDWWHSNDPMVRLSVRNPFDYFVLRGSDDWNDETVLKEFWNGIETGIGLAEDDPRYALRKHILNKRAAKVRGAVALPQLVEAALVVKAWEAWVTRTPKRQMMWRPNENFPALVNTDGAVIIPAFD